MNNLLVPLTNACTLVTLNYIALRIHNMMFIRSYEKLAIPLLTGIASVMMMIQPFPTSLCLDLRFAPITMAGLRYGPVVGLLSAFIPAAYCLGTHEANALFEIFVGLLMPALLSSLFHRKQYMDGFSPIRIRDGLYISLISLAIRLVCLAGFTPLPFWQYAFNELSLLAISCCALVVLIVMFNDENHRCMIQREMELLANQDGLTKLPNLRSFLKIAQAMADRRKIAIFMIDIDHFKQYNDQHGHLMGDDLLREAGQLLRHSIGVQDYVGRYGGEEFIVMCCLDTIPDTLRQAQTLCAIFEAYPFIGRERQPNGHVTISVGISVSEQIGQDLTQLISEADQALYDSKHQGRNRHTLFQQHAWSHSQLEA